MINISELNLEVLTAAFEFNKWAVINIEGVDVRFEYTTSKLDESLFLCEVIDPELREHVQSHARSVLYAYMMVLFGDDVFSQDGDFDWDRPDINDGGDNVDDDEPVECEGTWLVL